MAIAALLVFTGCKKENNTISVTGAKASEDIIFCFNTDDAGKPSYKVLGGVKVVVK